MLQSYCLAVTMIPVGRRELSGVRDVALEYGGHDTQHLPRIGECLCKFL